MGRGKHRSGAGYRRSTRTKPRALPRGTLSLHVSGYGFVRTAEGEYFIPRKALSGAADGDLVEIALMRPHSASTARAGKGNSAAAADAGRRAEARVVRIIERAHQSIIGRYEVAEPFGVVVPLDARIPYDVFTQRSAQPDIEDGSLVRVRMVEYPTRRNAAFGVIEEVYPDDETERLGIDLVISRAHLATDFPEEALLEAKEATQKDAGSLLRGAEDLRERFVFTIDPPDAKDFDDALSLDRVRIGPREPHNVQHDEAGAVESDDAKGIEGKHRIAGTFLRLGVHIADVGRFVQAGSALDREARARATSTYLVDRVLPMLPPELSDDACSLRPDEDRNTITVDLYLHEETGKVAGYRIYRSVIRSNARLSYGEALEILRGRSSAHAHLALSDTRLAWRLEYLSRIAKQRAELRRGSGGIDFSTREAKVVLDGEGKPLRIDVREKNDATEVVEEAMILANETVARHLEKHAFPCIYRIHEQPEPAHLADLVPVFEEFPWFDERLKEGLITAQSSAIEEIIEKSKGRAEEVLVSSLLLRSMKRAVYSPVNKGHYGLASSCYCHFTSPIRRYPDLIVHRMLALHLEGVRDAPLPEKELAAIAEHASKMERIADDAARESQELKIIEYLGDYIGMKFSGVVSGVTTAGLFVELENTAEGIIPVRTLGNEYFAFDPKRHTLTGQESGVRYRLGQRIAVTLVEADPRLQKLEFALA